MLRDPVKAAIVGSKPGRDRVKDRYSVLRADLSVSVLPSHVHLSTRESMTAGGVKDTDNAWQENHISRFISP